MTPGNSDGRSGEDDVDASPVSDFDKVSCSDANTPCESNRNFFAISKFAPACLKGTGLPDNFPLTSPEQNSPLQLPFKFSLSHVLMQSSLRKLLGVINTLISYLSPWNHDGF